MAKKFVLDTNVLLLDHQAMFKFENNTVFIPMVVLEELDKFKKDSGDKGFHARSTARYLDKLNKRGDLSKGVKLDNGGKLIVSDTNMDGFEDSFGHRNNDNIILYHAIQNKAIIVSRDINVRVKARIKGLVAEDHEPTEIKKMDLKYTGFETLNIDNESFEELNKNRVIENFDGLQNEFKANQYLVVKSDTGGSRLARYHKKDNSIRLIREFGKNDIGLQAKNKEQRFALDAIMDPDIKLVSIMGKAGTGKTLIAVAAALSQVMSDEYYKLLVSRPIMPMGKDLGYLPGTLEEKLGPWTQPIFDNIDFLFETKRNGDNPINSKDVYSAERLMEQGLLEMEAITYIRGRSIANQIMIIDEAQNLSAHELKTIITRAGEGTKIILTGDVDQIDTPYLDKHNNGFSYVSDKFKDEPIAAFITLTKGERSELAEKAAEIL